MKRKVTSIRFLLPSLALVFQCSSGLLMAQDTFSYKTIDIPKLSQPIAFGINDLGQIVGVGMDESGNGHGFLYDHGKITLLDVPGAQSGSTAPAAINDLGQIVGSYSDNTTGESKAFLYFHGVFTAIDLPGGPAAINNLGDIVGSFGSSASSSNSVGTQGFKYSHGSITIINYPNSYNTQLSGINDYGDIVGWFYSPTAQPYLGFLYRNGTFSNPINYPGAEFTSLAAINDEGQIIGGSDKTTFLYEDGRFVTIQYPNPNTSYTGVNAINNRGDILGNYSIGNTLATSPFLAFPIDDRDK